MSRSAHQHDPVHAQCRRRLCRRVDRRHDCRRIRQRCGPRARVVDQRQPPDRSGIRGVVLQSLDCRRAGARDRPKTALPVVGLVSPRAPRCVVSPTAGTCESSNVNGAQRNYGPDELGFLSESVDAQRGLDDEALPCAMAGSCPGPHPRLSLRACRRNRVSRPRRSISRAGVPSRGAVKMFVWEAILGLGFGLRSTGRLRRGLAGG